MTAPRVYTHETIAEELGISVDTVRCYLKLARRNRAKGINKAWDMPEPDTVIGRSPVWFSHSIDAWRKARPGKAHGLGGAKRRKRKRGPRRDGLVRVDSLRSGRMFHYQGTEAEVAIPFIEDDRWIIVRFKGIEIALPGSAMVLPVEVKEDP